MSPAASAHSPGGVLAERATQHDLYSGVQILRFVAAFLVVITHASLVVSERMSYLGSGVWEKGGVGVSLFFVISGFVIVLSGTPLMARNDGWKTFAYRRLIRIVPLYWIATTLKLLAVLLDPALTVHSGLNWWHVLCSYLFLPSRNPLGVVTPLHAVGWTLTFEMFFYFAFCLALLLKMPPTRFVSIVFAALVAWGLMDPKFSRTWSAFVYTDPIVLEFVLGMLIAHLAQSGLRPPPWVGLFSIVLGTAMIWHFDVLIGWPSFFCHGIPSAMIVAGVVWIEPSLTTFNLRVPRLLGESSYALYLFHPFLIAAGTVALGRLKMTGISLSIALISLLAVVLSVAIHLWIESPMTLALKRRVRTGRPLLVRQMSPRS